MVVEICNEIASKTTQTSLRQEQASPCARSAWYARAKKGQAMAPKPPSPPNLVFVQLRPPACLAERLCDHTVMSSVEEGRTANQINTM